MGVGYIYKIENKINGKVYIGQTTQDIRKRLSQHKCKTLNRTVINKVINKYGSENFSFEMIKK
ncbi:MAG: GIY-YIG nuclease family protein [bacterium]